MTYRFRGDRIIAPGHGSEQDGYLEFAPLTHRVRSIMFQYVSQGSTGNLHTGAWPPESDELNFPPRGKFFEMWHEGLPGDEDNLTHTIDGMLVFRYLQSGGFDYHAFRRRAELPGGVQTINQVGTIFWDLSDIPAGMAISDAELIGWTFTAAIDLTFTLRWLRNLAPGSDGYPGWLETYQLTVPGSAFRGPAGDITDPNQYPNSYPGASRNPEIETWQSDIALPLRGASQVSGRRMIGLQCGFAEADVPDLGTNAAVGMTMNYGDFDSRWADYQESGDPEDAERALASLPVLRLWVEPDEQVVSRYNARQVRARHAMVNRSARIRF